jgi:hypothetical protein
VPAVLRRLVLLVAGVIGLSACQVDVVLDIDVEPDGSGTVRLEVVADAGVVDRVPTLAQDLVLDDAIEAGWAVEGPTATDDGGLRIVLTHDFEAIENGEATNLLQSLGPPFNDVELRRGTTGEVTTNQLSGNLGLPGGFDAFADDDLVAAVGAVPFADEIEASGATPAESMTAVVRAGLPGEVLEDGTNGTRLDDGRLEWTVPLDGSIVEWSARTEQAPSEGGAWARPLSIAALVALVAWVGFMSVFILYVAVARYRRARRHRHRPVAR